MSFQDMPKCEISAEAAMKTCAKQINLRKTQVSKGNLGYFVRCNGDL